MKLEIIACILGIISALGALYYMLKCRRLEKKLERSKGLERFETYKRLIQAMIEQGGFTKEEVAKMLVEAEMPNHKMPENTEEEKKND